MVIGISALVFLGFPDARADQEQTGQPAVSAEPAGESVLQLDSDKVVVENGKTYRIVSTPFGMMKQLVEADRPSKKPQQALPGAPPAPPAAGRLNPKRAPQAPARNAAPEPAPKSNAPAKLLKQKEKSPAATGQRPVLDQKQEGPVSKLVDPSGSRAVPKVPTSEKAGMTLNFDDADLYEVIRTMADILHITYIVDPNVRGRVTIHTAGTISPPDFFPVFFQILEANGLTAVKEGAVYKITSLKEAARMPLPIRQEADVNSLPPGERVLIQIVPLKNINPVEMIKILTPFISAEGTIMAQEKSNSLLLVDKGVNIVKALKLVESFDLDLFAGINHRFFKIEHNAVDEVIKVLQDVLATYRGASETEVKLIPIERLNMLLVLSRQSQAIETVAQFLKTLDGPNETVAPRLHVYKVKNGQAGELATLLEGIFLNASPPKTEKGKSDDKKAESGQGAEIKTSSNPFAITKSVSDPTKSRVSPEYGEAASGTLKAPIKITPDLTRNALIIEAIPADYQSIQNILASLDVMPRQVLIEVMIADVKLTENDEFGVEWNYVSGSGGPSTEVLSAAMGSNGLSYIVGQTNRWSAALSALAKEDRVNVLSSPSVLASNDKEAKINISTEVPVASAQYQTTNLSNQSMVQTNIQYRNTGIILSVTPHINDNGLVSMTVNQEVSDKAGDVLVGGTSYPSFFQRSVSTNLTVAHNQTIVIGGLIKEDKSEGQAGVPILHSIPIIGHLFGKEIQSTSRNEMIILITPRVIADLSAVDAVTGDFKARLGNL